MQKNTAKNITKALSICISVEKDAYITVENYYSKKMFVFARRETNVRCKPRQDRYINYMNYIIYIFFFFFLTQV